MKKERSVIKKHILIPLSLCLVIVVIGIYMTLSDTISEGQTKEYRYGQDKRNAKNVSYPITGTDTIAIGLFMAGFITYIWTSTKK